MAEGVLAAIVEQKRSDVAQRLAAGTLNAEPTPRSLRAALARPGARFIMEVKKASPSGHRSSISVEAAVDAYAPIADAISVLTDTPFFSGSLGDLRTARARFEGPLLAKDFILDPAQVVEARAHGADAVLAIMAVLSNDEAAAVLDQAHRLAMDVLVEVHDEAELERALGLGAGLIGINNRNLNTLRTDLSVTERLAPLIPEDRIVVSESGIRTKKDVERLGPMADAFLVGSSLMGAENIVQATRTLVFGPVKICGLTSAGDVRLAGAAGATHAGFIFVPGTPRCVGSEAGALIETAKCEGLVAVGVFRDQPTDEACGIARTLQLDAIQLHGGDDQLGAMRSRLPNGCEIWAACAVGRAADPPRMGADRTLFDTRQGRVSGGSGRVFDWRLISGRPDLGTAFLAGGIGPHNVRAAGKVGAFGLDVGSSTEASPGRKDTGRLRSLFEALRPDNRRSVGCA